METWISLRAGGKLHGELDPTRLLLRIRQGDRVFLFDLAATAEAGRSVVEWCRERGKTEGLPEPNICAMIEE